MALRDPALQSGLAASVRAYEEHLAALLTGRAHGGAHGATVTPRQAARLAAALRALLVGLSQALVLGLTEATPEAAPEAFFADAATALTAPEVLGPP
ncbi:hypothetical protein ACIBKX_14830 [Streptomyces sp. NPDC050658]|uniref:hypothetical protein n=1 Tax=unclassified Streptomyces TaxID=2593676 RepID=UPI0034424BC2